MKVPYLSASRLKMAKNCTQQYEYHYDPKSDDEITLKAKANHRDSSQAARVGTNVHNALEHWRKPDKDGKTGKLTFDRLMEYYEKENAISEVDFQFYEDGKRMLTRWFDRRGRQPVRIIDTERGFGTHRSPYKLSNGTPVFGFIDAILEHRDGTIELLDYKTQRADITQAEADNSIQAGIYLAVAREWWPEKKIKFSFDLLRYGVVSTTWSDEKIDSFKDWLKTQYEWISKIEKGNPTIGDGCKWCAFADICPKAQELMQKGAWDLLDPTMGEDLDDMLTELATIKASKQMLDRRQRSIDAHLKNNVFDRQMPVEECVIETQNWSVVWGETTRTEYIPSLVQDLVPPSVFGQMVSLSKTAVEKVIPILPEDLATQVRKTAIVKPQRRMNIKKKESKADE
jgi:RecB family exonuclease